MKPYFIYIIILFICAPAQGQGQETDQLINRSMAHSTARMERYAQKSERRTRKSERRMARYERKLAKSSSRQTGTKHHQQTALADSSKQTARPDTIPPAAGKEPTPDSLQTAYTFAQKTGIATDKQAAASSLKSINKAQKQADVSQRTKAELHQRTRQQKGKYIKGNRKEARLIRKMEQESYYYTAQVNQYRKALKEPASTLEKQALQTLSKDPRWNEFTATLPKTGQDPEKMQPKQLVQQMMESQAGAISPEPLKLLKGSRKEGTNILDKMSGEAGNIDNAAQMPSFTPNPYKTKSFWERIDIGFNLEFGRKTYHLPSSGKVAVQLCYNVSTHWRTGITGNYRFGLGEIKHIRFSHMGGGYGSFVNYTFKWGIGLQAGFERNYHVAINSTEAQSFGSAWTNALLLGVTKEYNIGRKVKGTVAVFYDFLHRQHTPQTNAIVWQMGWKF